MNADRGITPGADAPAPAATPPAARIILPRGVFSPDERVIIATRPSLWFVLLVRAETLIGCAAAGGAGHWLATAGVLPLDPRAPVAMAMAAASLVVLWQTLEWSARAYILTNRRVVRCAGVVRRVTTEAPVTNIQSVTLSQSLRERLVGIGTVQFTTAGGAPGRMAWLMAASPAGTLETVRRVIDDARSVLPLPASLNGGLGA